MEEIRILHRIRNDNYCEEYTKYEEYMIAYDENTLLKAVVHHFEHSQLNIRDYYNLSLRADLFKCEVPYLIHKNIVVWNRKIEEVKVVDIIATHGIKDAIMVESYIAEHGGYYPLMEIIELWENVYPMLMEIAQYLGVLFVFEKSLKKVAKIFIKKKVSPLNIIEFVLSRDSWNHHELAEDLDIDEEESKHFLKALGYKWSNKKRLYINDNTKFIQNKFYQMSVITRKKFEG